MSFPPSLKVLRLIFLSIFLGLFSHQGFSFELNPVKIDVSKLKSGTNFWIYDLQDAKLAVFPEITEKTKPNFIKTSPQLVLAAFSGGFDKVPNYNNFILRGQSYYEAKEDQKKSFRLRTNRASYLMIDGQKLIQVKNVIEDIKEFDVEVTLPKGWHQIEIGYIGSNIKYKEISLWWYNEDNKNYEYVPGSVLSYLPSNDLQLSQVPLNAIGQEVKYGDRIKLNNVHPAYTLQNLNLKGFNPKVGGMDFMSDGRLLISTWDSLGQIYVIKGALTGDTNQISYQRIAWGLAEPLGLKVVNDRIFVLQKQELTELIDLDNDGIIDEYKTVCNAWGATGNFHEFAFGLLYKEGYFYAALAIAIQPGGRSTIPQNKDRGKVIKIGLDGSLEFIASGLRTPNGLGWGPNGELLLADNQGDWLPSCKLVHIKKDGFYNNYAVDLNSIGRREATPPIVWFPQNELGNSTSQPITCQDGPYKGQVLLGDVHYGGLQRVFVENVKGSLQGCAFKFSQGFQGGTNRIIYGPDSALYIGEIGAPGNWGQYGKEWYGLQKIKFNGKIPFELLRVESRSNGFMLTFTQALDIKAGNKPQDYELIQWRYEPTMQYGGPKLDQDSLKIQSVQVSKDRKQVFLEIDDLIENRVVYIYLPRSIKSSIGEELWSHDAYYTLNQISDLKEKVLAVTSNKTNVKSVALKPKPKTVAKWTYTAPTPATLDQGRTLITTSGCLGCHNLSQKILGPSYKMIAEKYPENEANVKKLTDKVYFGGGGVWGEQAMSTHTHLKKDDITKMVQYILSLK